MGGYDVVACPDPMAPERLSHLLVPELGLAFLSASPAQPLPGRPSRRLRLDAMVDRELLRRSRARLRFAQKVSSALTGEAVESLSQAKAMHDGWRPCTTPMWTLPGCRRWRTGWRRSSSPWPERQNGGRCSRRPPRRGPRAPLISLKSQVQVHISLDPRTTPVWVYCHISKS